MGKKNISTNRVAKLALINELSKNELIIPPIPNAHPTSDNVGAIVSFTFDNGIRREIIEDYGRGNGFPSGGFKSIFNSKNAKYNLSFGFTTPPGAIPEYMTLSEITALQSEGVEWMAHVRASDNPTFTDEQAAASIKQQKDIIEGYGIYPESCNYLQGINNIAYRSAIRKYYRSASTVGPGSSAPYNKRPINQYRLVRMSMDSGNYNAWVARVDLAIAQNAWIIFYGHPYTDEWYTTLKDDDGNADAGGDYTWQKISRLIDYIQAKENYGYPDGVNIMTYSEALDIYGNVIDVGYAEDIQDSAVEGSAYSNDVTRESFRVSKKGEVGSRKLDAIDVGTFLSQFGYQAGWLSTDTKLTAIGANSGLKNTGSGLTAIGQKAGEENTGNSSTAIGVSAAFRNTGSNLVAIGSSAGSENTGLSVCAIGNFAAQNNAANEVSAVGYQAAYNNASGGRGLTAIGYRAGYYNAGIYNTGIGYEALRDNSGNRSLGVGYQSGHGNTVDNLVAIGYEAGENNTEAGVFLVEHRYVTADNPLIKGYFETGAIILGAPAIAVADANMGNSRMSFYVDETSGTEKLHFKVKLSDGTVKTGEIALA